MKVLMKYRKSTKGTYVFNEVLEDGREPALEHTKIPSLYIRRSAFPGEPPRSIAVTVEVI